MSLRLVLACFLVALAVVSESVLSEPSSEARRPFSSSRPGSTVPTTTIDVGHFQFETQIATYTVQEVNSEKATQVAYPIPSVRFGLTQSSEVLVAFAPHVQNEFRVPGKPAQKISGMGDTVLVYKYNVRGNDGEAFGMALMPMLKAPTNTGGIGNNKWEPSMAIPLARSLESGWAFLILPQVDLRKNADDSGMHLEYNYPLNISHNIAGPVDGFSDIVMHTSNDRAFPTTSYWGTGIMVRDGANAQYDIGCNFGLNQETPDYSIYLGWSFRPD